MKFRHIGNFATLCLKDRNLKPENFTLLAWVKKTLLKKSDRGGGFTPPLPPLMHNKVKQIFAKK